MLVVTVMEAGTYNEETLEFTAGEAQEIEIEGRAERSRGGLVTLTDGSTVNYTYDFYSKRSTDNIPFGSNAILYNGDAEVWKGKTKGSPLTQSGTVIWL